MNKIILMTLLLSLPTHASVLLEPYGGYSVGNISTTPLSGSPTDANLQGAAYGGRAGLLFMHMVFVAFDYQALSATERQSGNTTSYSWKQNTLFATLGLQMPMGLRLFGSYGWKTQAVESTTPDPTTYTGTAAKAGIGWQIMSHAAINIEYSIYNLKDKTVNNVNTPLANSYSKFTYSSAMVNLSIPFTFLHWDGGGSTGGGHSHAESSGGGSAPPPGMSY